MVEQFTDLLAWQCARELRKHVRAICERPGFRDRILANQLRRSVDSVPANIAEGFGRASLNDRIHFFRMAIGSSYETQSHLYLAFDDRLCSSDELAKLIELARRTDRLTIGFMNALKRAHVSRA